MSAIFGFTFHKDRMTEVLTPDIHIELTAWETVGFRIYKTIKTNYNPNLCKTQLSVNQFNFKHCFLARNGSGNVFKWTKSDTNFSCFLCS